MTNPDRVFSNSCHLCVRTIATTIAELFSVRLCLSALGVERYGAYAVVLILIGVLKMFNCALESTAQRFVGNEMGKCGGCRLQEVFSSLLTLTLCFSALVVLVSETLGLWYLTTRLNVGSVPGSTVMLVYQAGVCAAVLQVMQYPFSAMIVSGEKMGFFSLIGCVESMVAVVSALFAFGGLVAYAVSLFVGQAVVLFLFALQCRRLYPDLTLAFGRWRSTAVLTQGRFFAWWMLSGLGNAFKYQGTSLLLNGFCGVAFNATWNLALRARLFFLPLCMDILQAISPRTYKVWAGRDFQVVRRLTRCSLLVSVVTVCIPAALAFVFAPVLVRIWLGGEMPVQIVAFVRCSLVGMAADALSQPLVTVINASEDIAANQVIVTSLAVVSFVLAGVFLSLGCAPWLSMASVSGFNALACVCRYVQVRILLNRGKTDN